MSLASGVPRAPKVGFGGVIRALRFDGRALLPGAIACAVAEHERDRPAEERIGFRIGINLGDVIIEDDDIYGDGVNVAARLEGLPELQDQAPVTPVFG
jgi:class 3 adenylate cyclase